MRHSNTVRHSTTVDHHRGSKLKTCAAFLNMLRKSAHRGLLSLVAVRSTVVHYSCVSIFRHVDDTLDPAAQPQTAPLGLLLLLMHIGDFSCCNSGPHAAAPLGLLLRWTRPVSVAVEAGAYVPTTSIAASVSACLAAKRPASAGWSGLTSN